MSAKQVTTAKSSLSNIAAVAIGLMLLAIMFMPTPAKTQDGNSGKSFEEQQLIYERRRAAGKGLSIWEQQRNDEKNIAAAVAKTFDAPDDEDLAKEATNLVARYCFTLNYQDAEAQVNLIIGREIARRLKR